MAPELKGISFFEKAGLFRPRDIHPADTAPVIAAEGGRMLLKNSRWGFPGRENGLVINARRETVRSMRLFSEGIERHRIVLPASGFYEWNQAREKYTFRHPKQELLYLAGFCDQFGGEERFVILTGEAGHSMSPVHDRQPLVIKGNDLQIWLSDGSRLDDFLKGPAAEFRREAEYEQLSFL